MSARASLLSAGLKAFHARGYDHATIEAIRAGAGVSNGSFFHFFPTKEALAAAIFMDALAQYHQAMLAPLRGRPGAATGVARLVRAHLNWVVSEQPLAQFLFEQSRAEWLAHVQEEQRAANRVLRDAIEKWRAPLVSSGALRPMDTVVFFSQVIGPSQIFCRGWLSGRDITDPREHADELIDCAVRATVGPDRRSVPRSPTRSRRR